MTQEPRTIKVENGVTTGIDVKRLSNKVNGKIRRLKSQR
jgi:hypothetical protein